MIKLFKNGLKMVFGLVFPETLGKPVTVKQVTDGDTLVVSRFWPFESRKVRLWGIDCPELKQEGGTEARKALAGFVQGQVVYITPCRGLTYGRDVHRITLSTGHDLGAAMVRSGWAWDSEEYSKGYYAQQEKIARLFKRGIWKTGRAVDPRSYRKAKKNGSR